MSGHLRHSGVLAAIGLAMACLLPGPALATYPGPNGLIAFSADAGTGAQIWTIQSNGHDLRQVTHFDGDAIAPDWSPDGEFIVIQTDRHLGDDSDEVAVQIMKADGSHLTNLTPSPVCCSGDPSFTPDGTRIVFSRFDGVEEAVWSMNLDGSDQHRIVSTPTGASDPNVSPDGTTLSFRVGDGVSENGALFRSTIDGSDVVQVTPFNHISIKHDWSPDGGLLLFTDNADTGDPADSTNIATIRPDGTGMRHLTSYQGGAISVFAGSYSPDGRWIVLRFEDHGSFSLYRMRADGTHLKRIADLGDLKPRLTDWGPRAGSDDDSD